MDVPMNAYVVAICTCESRYSCGLNGDFHQYHITVLASVSTCRSVHSLADAVSNDTATSSRPTIHIRRPLASLTNRGALDPTRIRFRPDIQWIWWIRSGSIHSGQICVLDVKYFPFMTVYICWTSVNLWTRN